MINNLKSVIDVWKKMQYILTSRQKRISIGIFVLTILGALAETLGVSVIIPLVQAMLDVDALFENQYVAVLVKMLHINTGKQLIIWMCVCVCLVYIIKNLYLIFLAYVRAVFSNSVKRELAIKMMGAYMKRGYTYYLTVNSQEILRGVGSDIASIYEILSNVFKILAEGLTVLCICIFVFYVDAKMAGGIVLVVGVTLGALILFFRKKMSKIGATCRQLENIKNQHVYESILGIKDVLVFRKQKFFLNIFESSYHEVQKYDTKRIVASETPVYFIEAICVCGLIMVVGYKFVMGSGVENFIPQLAAFAVAAFRVLPSVGRISSSFNQFAFSCPAMNAVFKNLKDAEQYERKLKESREKRIQNKDPLVFKQKIEIQNIDWHYPNSDVDVLHGLSLSIKKGTSVAFIGQSGAGKSTLADILLGLLSPQKGNICVDGVSIYTNMDDWGKLIGYVPQWVYILDDSVRKNVAYGIKEDEIDDTKVWKALEQAQLAKTIKEFPKGLDTKLGDRGMRFSGGQRQRIAIARALYNNPEIVIMDEATAALDNDTESAVMGAIDALHGQKTLVIIAHRLSTIRNCDEIYEIGAGVAKKRIKAEVIGIKDDCLH